MTTNMFEATDEKFEQDVLHSAVPVLVDFWAPWCAPCRMVAPVVEELSKEFEGRFLFAKLNTDEYQETAVRYGIMSIPTLAIFKEGKLVDAVVGAVPKRVLKAKLDQHAIAAVAS